MSREYCVDRFKCKYFKKKVCWQEGNMIGTECIRTKALVESEQISQDCYINYNII